jgi:tetratricopeptide (TPR) repeat protein
MKKQALRLGLFLFFQLMVTKLPGQPLNQDSVIQVLRLAETDSAKGYVLDKCAQHYFAEGDYQTTMVLTLQGLMLYESIPDSAQIGAHYNVIGNIYFQQMNFEKALEYFQLAANTFSACGNGMQYAGSHGNMSNVYRVQGKFEKAITYSLIALETSKKLGDIKSIGMAHNNLGAIYSDLGQFGMAKAHLDTSIAIKTDLNDQKGLVSSYFTMVATMNGLNDEEKAVEYANEGLKLATGLGLKSKVMMAHEILAELYANMEKFDAAFSHLLIYANMRDSLIHEESVTNTNLLTEKYKTEKKQNENLILEKENTLLATENQNKNLWLTIGFTGTAFVASLFLVFVVRSNGRKKRKQIEFEKSVLEMEQKALRSQMNPHFIFNAINSIQSYILNKSEHEAYDYLAKFSKLIRTVLVNSQDKNLMLHQELDMIRLYVEMEQMRFSNRFHFELSVNDNVNTYDITIPAMLIQPYVENAIWHGLMNLGKNRRGELKLDLAMQDTMLKITVADNGIGRQRAAEFRKMDNHQSMGMQLTEQRLLMINKIESLEKARVTITDLCDQEGRPTGTRVEIFIPVQVHA